MKKNKKINQIFDYIWIKKRACPELMERSFKSSF